MNPIDTYRDAFLAFLEQGMSYEEARDQFDRKLLSDAVNAELERGDCAQIWDHTTGLPSNACGHETLFDMCVKASFEERNRKDFEEQATPLMLAGWTMEVPNPTNSKDFWRQTQIMSLYWRAPSKRPGKPGRRYLSTNQAFNAMTRGQASKQGEAP